MRRSRQTQNRRSSVVIHATSAAAAPTAVRTIIMRVPFVPLPSMQFEMRVDHFDDQRLALTAYGSEYAEDDTSGFLGPSSELFGSQRVALLYDTGNDYDNCPSVGVEAYIDSLESVLPSELERRQRVAYEEQVGENEPGKENEEEIAARQAQEENESPVLLIHLRTSGRVSVKKTVCDPPVLVADVTAFLDDPEVDRYVGEDGLDVTQLRGAVVGLLEDVMALDIRNSVYSEYEGAKVKQMEEEANSGETQDSLARSTIEPGLSSEQDEEGGSNNGDDESNGGVLTDEDIESVDSDASTRFQDMMYTTYEMMAKLDDTNISFWLASCYEPGTLEDYSGNVLDDVPAQIALETRSTCDRLRLAGTVLEKVKIERGGYSNEELESAPEADTGEDYITQDALREYNALNADHSIPLDGNNTNNGSAGGISNEQDLDE